VITHNSSRPRRSVDAPPLYRQVFLGIEALALATALEEVGPLPTEAQLTERFGVSRGTVRQATGELVRQGLLRAEAGRGTFVDKRSQVRRIVSARLTQVAVPDSRFDLDVSRFVPDFENSSRCDDYVRALDAYRDASTVFIAPDNCLERMRRLALDDGKTVVVPTYGMRRGIVRLRPRGVRKADRDLAATLDGLERFGERLSLSDLAASPPIDVMITGAIAVTAAGAHVGGGQAYLDLEWAILAELNLVAASTPVVAVVHSCQVIEADLAPGRFDVTVDVIVTPDACRETGRPYARPAGISWDQIDADPLARVAYLAELHAQRSEGTR
jgi:5-formyltetrahydrofolate cyclo-ligase